MFFPVDNLLQVQTHDDTNHPMTVENVCRATVPTKVLDESVFFDTEGFVDGAASESHQGTYEACDESYCRQVDLGSPHLESISLETSISLDPMEERPF